MSEGRETPNLLSPETLPAETVATPETTQESETPGSLIGAPPVAATPEVVALTVEDINIPEGLIVPDEIRDEFLGLVNNQEMTPKDRAQALIDLQAKAAEQASEAASLQFQEQQRQWQDEVKNDPQLGGAKFQATLAGISRLVDQYGNEDFVNAMAATGAGNNIHVVRFFDKIAGTLNESGPVTGTPPAQPENAASRLFPSMKG